MEMSLLSLYLFEIMECLWPHIGVFTDHLSNCKYNLIR